MKKIFLTLALAFPLAAFAQSANTNNPGNVTLAWLPSIGDARTNNFFYRLYVATNASVATNLTVSLTNAYAGTNLSVTLTNLAPARWYFTVTAFSDGVESLPSNLAVYTIRNTPPAAPGSLGTVFIDTTIDLTNFVERGFFRLRVLP